MLCLLSIGAPHRRLDRKESLIFVPVAQGDFDSLCYGAFLRQRRVITILYASGRMVMLDSSLVPKPFRVECDPILTRRAAAA